MTTVNKDFMPPRGDYHKLIVYRKAECIYDITYHFAHTYLERGDRTIDQMVQAARSGKQNIAEGSQAATASKETELKLYNVAKASLQELLADYEDFRPHGRADRVSQAPLSRRRRHQGRNDKGTAEIQEWQEVKAKNTGRAGKAERS